MTDIVLRKLEPNDVSEKYLSWITDESNRNWISTLRDINTIADLQLSTVPRLTDSRYSIVGIFYNHQHIGNVQARNISDDECIISILIGEKEFRGKGVAKQALYQLLNTRSLIPATKNLIKYYAVINEKNIASQRLFLALSFEEVKSHHWPTALEPEKDNAKLFLLTKNYLSQ